MVVLLDSTFLLLVFHPDAQVPRDPKSNGPIERPRARVEHLIQTVSDAKVPVIIPTPVLAEILVMAGAAQVETFAALRATPGFRVTDFDSRAAIECAQLTSAAMKSGSKRGKAFTEPYQKVKIDRQIIAIAKVVSADTVYTMDRGLRTLAEAEGLNVFHLADTPLPPVQEQSDMFADK